MRLLDHFTQSGEEPKVLDTFRISVNYTIDTLWKTSEPEQHD